MPFFKRIRRTGREVAASIDFTRLDTQLPSPLSFSRADAAPCATRRRTIGAVGPSRTNRIRNSNMVGGTAGTYAAGGIPPNFHSVITNGSGLSVSMAFGTESGYPYTDFRFFGNAAAGTECGVGFETNNPPGASAAPGETLALSMGVRLVAGSFANVNYGRLRFQPVTNTGVTTGVSLDSADQRAAFTASPSIGARSQLIATIPTSYAGTTGAWPLLAFGHSAGAVDFTIRVGGVQYESGAIATPWIPTTNAAVTTTDWPRTNKIVCNVPRNPADLTGVAITNPTPNGLGTLTVVDDGAAVAASGLSALVPYGFVYKADNSQGNGTLGVVLTGPVGNLSPHTFSCWARGAASGATVFTSTFDAWNQLLNSGAKYARVVGANRTPSGAASQLKLNVAAGDVVYFVLAQLEEGTTATAVIPNTTGAALTVNTPPFGDMSTMAANAPRLDYNTSGIGRGQLLESSATNLFTESEFRNGVADAPLRAGPGIAAVPFPGFAGGIAVGYDGVNVAFAYKSNYMSVIGTTYSISVFVQMDDGGAPAFNANATGAANDFSLVIGANVLGSPAAYAVQSMGGGVYRVTCTATATTASNNFGVVKYQTNSNRTFKVTGYQLEATSYATSYIPTTTTALARQTDQLSVALSDIGWNASGHTFLVEWEHVILPGNPAVYPTTIFMKDAAGINTLQLFVPIGLYMNANKDGVALFSNVYFAQAVVAGNNRLAVSITPNGVTASVNGAAPVTVAGAVPTAAFLTLWIGGQTGNLGQALNGWLRGFKSWPRELARAELQAASAL